MNLHKLSQSTIKIADLYAIKNAKDGHHIRTIDQYMSGMVGDVGDLQKLIIAKSGYLLQN